MPEIGVVVFLTVAIVCVFLLKLVAILRGNSRSSGLANENDARLIQELHRGMERLEQRVESLETILLDSARGREEAKG